MTVIVQIFFDVNFYEIAFSLLIIFTILTRAKAMEEEDKKKLKKKKEKSQVRGFICWAFDLFVVSSCEPMRKHWIA